MLLRGTEVADLLVPISTSLTLNLRSTYLQACGLQSTAVQAVK